VTQTPPQFELGTDGVDGSRTSLRAASYAAGLARRQGARLVAVYVSDGSSMGGFGAFAPMAAGGALEASTELGEQLRAQALAGAAYSGVEVEFIVASGDPYRELTSAADKVRAEMIVVGASEAAGHRLVGSLAVRLVRAGRWPVTVVP
jgi:nucleotide-binding universal stress UspA family protein